MTSYQGGKKRIAKRIHEVIITIEQDIMNYKNNKKIDYIEPFVGMASVLYQFALDDNRDIYASDIHADLIKMWKSLQKGWKPPKKCSRKQYNILKRSPPSPTRAVIGFSACFNGNFFQGGFREQKKGVNVVKTASDNLLKMVPAIKNVIFSGPKSYDTYTPKGSLIYCDPPYKGNNLTSLFKEFNHTNFWNIMRKWSKNNIVFISEWEAPKDFVCVWSNNSVCVSSSSTIRYEDCLFVHESLYEQISEDVLDEVEEF